MIMSPNSHLYFDFGQGDPKQEPLNTAAIRERLSNKVVEAGGYIF